MLQNRIIRVISCAGHREHADPLLGMLKLSDVYEVVSANLVYKQLNSTSLTHFARVSSVHSQNTRDRNCLWVALPTSELS